MRNLLAALALALLALPARADTQSDCLHGAPTIALAACNALVEATGSSGAFVNRGNVYLTTGRYAEAKADYETAEKLDPDSSAAHYSLGYVALKTGDWDTAIAELNTTLKLDPGSAMTRNLLGAAYMNKKDYDRAFLFYDDAIKHDQNYAPTHFNRGWLYLLTGDLARAVADYDEAVKLDPSLRSETTATQFEAARTKLAGLPRQPVLAQETDTDSGNRVALVIGNGDYAAAGKLVNPQRDAEAVAAALKADGFTVVAASHDLDRAALIAALKDFGAKAAKADWAVIYFSGHGIQVKGANYILPIDASISNEQDVADQAISLDRLVAAANGARQIRMVILDACRINPFKLSDTNGTKGPADQATGLSATGAEALTTGSEGLAIMFAAGNNEVALDGVDQSNSPFAAALAKRLRTPGLELGRFFREVRADVLAATGNRQHPFVYDALPPEDLFFATN